MTVVNPKADNRIIGAPGTGRDAPAGVLRTLLIGLACAAVFGSAPLLNWTKALADGQLSGAAQDAAGWWNDAMSLCHADRPYAWLRGVIRAAEAGR